MIVGGNFDNVYYSLGLMALASTSDLWTMQAANAEMPLHKWLHELHFVVIAGMTCLIAYHASCG